MTAFGWWIALYFALATVAAGAGGAAALQTVIGRGDDGRVNRALIFALVAVAVGSLALILDLERPREFWLVWLHYNPASWISRGARILPAFGLLVVALLLVRSANTRQWTDRGLAAALSLAAVALATYPGLVLNQAVGRELFSSPLLPLLFLAGALHVGTVIARAPAFVELGAIAIELALFVGYIASVGVGRLAHHPDALALGAVAATLSWLVPVATRRWSRLETVRIISVVLGCLALRGMILTIGQIQ